MSDVDGGSQFFRPDADTAADSRIRKKNMAEPVNREAFSVSLSSG
jgi:hypothetical protein